MSVLQESKMRGNLSADLFGCEFYRWWTSAASAMNDNVYFISQQRTDSRDKIIEAYLRSKGLGSNGVAMLLASPMAFQWLAGIKQDSTSLREFLNRAQKNLPDPLAMVLDILTSSFIPVKPISNKITEQHLNDSEEGIKILVRLKQGGKRMPMAFEGEYRNEEPGHSKFWTVSYIGGGTPFRASWGKIGHLPQGHKDYTEAEVRDLVRDKTVNGGYVKFFEDMLLVG